MEERKDHVQGASSRLAHLEKLSRIFSNLPFVICVNREIKHDVTSDGKRQRVPLIFCSFLVILNKSHQTRKMSPTIYCKYKYFHSAVQTAEDGRQKFHLCRLPSDVTSCSISLLILTTTTTATRTSPNKGFYKQNNSRARAL